MGLFGYGVQAEHVTEVARAIYFPDLADPSEAFRVGSHHDLPVLTQGGRPVYSEGQTDIFEVAKVIRGVDRNVPEGTAGTITKPEQPEQAFEVEVMTKTGVLAAPRAEKITKVITTEEMKVLEKITANEQEKFLMIAALAIKDQLTEAVA